MQNGALVLQVDVCGGGLGSHSAGEGCCRTLF